ncbi:MULTISPECIES: hypothetical protein [unclassified Streptomyces]|uniref:hypothetical protein n=1 Tax=unclassified Streptomyces TaxID=2593676 RepID=UPI0006AF5799|nr:MULTISPECIES: hypothetical protein [unclassified Streptomyces]KOX20587.1 hypothetical protein ADL06_27425 [Streptomyces sp. NRRL F-6491]KOX39860.1 hypothetical protein ADL08_23950 [Streptomyces sp. NRRL F-6492]
MPDLRVPLLVLLAGRSRTHRAAEAADRVRRTLPEAEVALLPDATHHSLPLTEPARLDARPLAFLG